MPMQPSPSRETMRSVVPKRRFSITASLTRLMGNVQPPSAIIGSESNKAAIRREGPMSGITMRLAASLMLISGLLLADAWAQDAKPQRVRGQIVSIDGNHLVVKGPDGKNFD